MIEVEKNTMSFAENVKGAASRVFVLKLFTVPNIYQKGGKRNDER